MEPQAYLDEVLTLMQTYSINRLTISWDDLRAKVHAKASGARSIADLGPAIREAVMLLGDRHSFYRAKDGRARSSVCSSPASFSIPDIPSSVGYIKMDAFAGASTSAEAIAYSDRIMKAIKSADSKGITGWLVDLRQNTGGNMWPMIAGLSPLLGEGPLGCFIDPTEHKVAWELRGGVAYLDGKPVIPNQATYRLHHAPSRVAVLTDSRTASSGEAVVTAFKGLPGTRFFGTPTSGLSTANRTFALSDGATLCLTGAVMADRTGKRYGGPIIPDVVVESSGTAGDQAIQWLETGN